MDLISEFAPRHWKYCPAQTPLTREKSSCRPRLSSQQAVALFLMTSRKERGRGASPSNGDSARRGWRRWRGRARHGRAAVRHSAAAHLRVWKGFCAEQLSLEPRPGLKDLLRGSECRRCRRKRSRQAGSTRRRGDALRWSPGPVYLRCAAPPPPLPRCPARVMSQLATVAWAHGPTCRPLAAGASADADDHGC